MQLGDILNSAMASYRGAQPQQPNYNAGAPGPSQQMGTIGTGIGGGIGNMIQQLRQKRQPNGYSSAGGVDPSLLMRGPAMVDPTDPDGNYGG